MPGKFCQRDQREQEIRDVKRDERNVHANQPLKEKIPIYTPHKYVRADKHQAQSLQKVKYARGNIPNFGLPDDFDCSQPNSNDKHQPRGQKNQQYQSTDALRQK